MSLTNFQDAFTRIRNVPDRYEPIIEHRQLEEVLVGYWFFGLIPRYEYFYTEWEEQKENK